MTLFSSKRAATRPTDRVVVTAADRETTRATRDGAPAPWPRPLPVPPWDADRTALATPQASGRTVVVAPEKSDCSPVPAPKGRDKAVLTAIAGEKAGLTTLAAPPRPVVRERAPSVAAPLARHLVDWMVQVGLASSDAKQTPGSESAAPWLRLEPASPEAQRRQRALRAAFDKLDDAMLDCVVWFMVRRAHAEHAEPAAATVPLVRGLQRALDRVAAGQGYTQVVRPRGAEHLLFLSAPHYDGCLFDPAKPAGGGGQGSFFVGMTRRGHPVAVKGTHLGAKTRGSNAASLLPQPTHAVAAGAVDGLGREAHQLRSASNYDVLHLVQHEAYRYLVIRLFCGDLAAHAGTLINLQPTESDPAALQAGLFGPRYLLQQVLRPLRTLHEVKRVVHQDVKPVNLFLDRDKRQLELGDFGVSARLGPDGTAPYIGHTERYAAPEQRRQAGSVTPATDIFCLGAMLYDLLLQHSDAVHDRRKQLPHGELVAALMPTTQRVGQLPNAQREQFYRALADEAPEEGSDAPLTAALVLTRAHFRNMHDALSALDRPLAELLRAMVARDGSARPTARQALAYLDEIGFDADAAPQALDRAWTYGVPAYRPVVDARLQELGAALRAIDHSESAKRHPQGGPT